MSKGFDVKRPLGCSGWNFGFAFQEKKWNRSHINELFHDFNPVNPPCSCAVVKSVEFYCLWVCY